jgi:hypothetical protein
MHSPQNWFKSKFTKTDLHGKKVAFKMPHDGKDAIDDFHVIENPEGLLFIEVNCVFYDHKTREVMVMTFAFAQDWIDKIERNTDAKIQADFIV